MESLVILLSLTLDLFKIDQIMTPSSVLDGITLSTLDQSNLQSLKSYITRVKHRLALNNKQIYPF